MNTLIYFILTIGYIGFFIWGLKLSRRNIWTLTNTLLLVIIGLIYDNLIIAVGRFIGEGDLLEGLSYVRYLLHALFTPTLILFALGICLKLGFPWAKKTFWKGTFSLITVGLILYELFTSVIGLELKSNEELGLLTYESVESAGPLMVIFITIVLVIIGILLAKKFRFYWLLIGTIVMTGGSLVARWIESFPIMNILEFILILSLLLTKRFQVSRNSE